MGLLIPDVSVEQPLDTFIWCTPVGDRDWNLLVQQSFTFKCVTPGHMRYLHRIGRGRQKIILALWHPIGMESPWLGDPVEALSREAIEQECAWLRLIKDYQQPIYVVPHGRPLTMHDVMIRAMGTSPHLVQDTNSMTEVKDGDTEGN